MRLDLCTALAACALAGSASGQVSFAFTPGPGLTTLFSTDPVKAAGIMSGVSAAATKWSALLGDPVTLRLTVDYDASLPALGAAYSTFLPGGFTYSSVKAGMVADVTSAFDVSAVTHLQPGPALAMWRNDMLAGAPYGPILDAGVSLNNMSMDITTSNAKALGLLPGHSGGPGSDGTIKFGGAAFDFDPSDGITPLKYDFVGVALHEIGHNMGFISGVDTMATLVPPGAVGPGGDPDGIVMATALDLFRYSTDSVGAGLFVPDISLPTPGFGAPKYFSLDGGASIIDLFSTGTALAGDMKGAGHWKSDGTLGLMDPDLAAGFALTSAFTAMTSGPTPSLDLMALDVIGWNVIPAPGSASLLGMAGLLVARRRR